MTPRLERLRDAILRTRPAVCAERALLVTEYFRRPSREPMIVRKAEALAHVLRRKRMRVYPDELLVGCFTSHRVGGSLYPELHGVAMMEDLFRFEKRKVNPLAISPADRRRLLAEVVPFWLPRALPGRVKGLAFLADQWNPTEYLINETGGIAHFVPDYARLLALGTDGIRREASGDSPFARAVRIVCDGLDDFAAGYGCVRVPKQPARTLHDALQSILFAQIALNLESLDNGISPGRLDQILLPCYDGDRGRAFELLGCFALKLCEIVPVFSQRTTRFHGGLMSGQAVAIGGTDAEGRDATNELTYLFLDVMDAMRTRQPNYHARIHAGSPDRYRARIAEVLAAGSVSPAVYNDEVIVPMLRSRDYAMVGCVEPVVPGRSFLSTDAALVNLPLCLDRALGRASACRSVEEVIGLFGEELQEVIDRLVEDLHAVERANARLHPTPLTSALLGGCIERDLDATAGGATYNGSGLQGVGVVDVGDSLAAIETVVFREGRATMSEAIAACRADFRGREGLRSRLLRAPKYGNDDPLPDGFAARAMRMFAESLKGRVNTRGGPYVAGFYSMTSHQGFGEIVGALPSGRKRGEPFSSGLSPGHGADRRGPTAALRSVAGLPLSCAANGVNFNLQIDPWAARDGRLRALIEGALDAGAMQEQVNVLDPKVLLEARDQPGRYPGLLVRVSGYSAYFDDLSPAMKDEVIRRTFHISQPFFANPPPACRLKQGEEVRVP
ncbi:MAG: formate acetyltransferase [Planctomycetes bacterium]|nr:formate acetyltransferase [Planctomycetota bacterium]